MPFDIVGKLNAARVELLDLGLRNPLINYRTRVRKVDVVGESSVEIYKILVTDARQMSFVPIPQKLLDEENQSTPVSFDKSEPDWESIFAEVTEGDGNGVPRRHLDTYLQTRLAPSNLHAKLLALHNDARTYIEEQGVSILFLAVGFLHWYEADTSDEKRRAPLILIPVELERSSARERFQIAYTGDEIGPNLSLYEKLRTEFKIRLPDLSADENDFDVQAYLSSVGEVISGQARWSVNHNEIVLGFFSFGKFLMYRDLASEVWPEGKRPSNHSVLNAVLGDGFREEALTAPDDANIDTLITPNDVNQVVDADSTQMLAILDVNVGHNLVIQGPPGTGKSQTITNIIAESVGLGKKVLFVSEKMAALDVVKRRLDMTGLGDAVLELHSHKTNKKAVLAELERTLHLGRPVQRDVADDVQSLTSLRDRLNAYCQAANTPILSTRVTPVAAIGRYVALGKDVAELPRLDFSAMRTWTDADYKRHRILVEELERCLKTIGVPDKSPFWGVQRTVLLPADERLLRNLLQEALSLTERIRAGASSLAARLQLSVPDNGTEVDVLCTAALRAIHAPHLKGIRLSSNEWQARRDDLGLLVQAGAKLSELRRRFDNFLIPDAWDQDLIVERQHFIAYGKKWWRVFSGSYRRSRARLAGLCKKPLSPNADHCLLLIDAVLEGRRQSQVYRQLESLGARLFGAQWQKERSEWSVLSKLVEWIVQIYQEIGDGQLPSGIISFLEGDPTLNDLIDIVNEVSKSLKEQRKKLDELSAELNLEQICVAGKAEPQPFSTISFELQLQIVSSWREHFGDLALMVRYNVLAAEFRNSNLAFVLPLAQSWEQASEKIVCVFDATWYGGLIEVAYAERAALNQFDRSSHEHTIEKFKELDRLLFEHNRLRLAQVHWQKLPNLQNGGELAVIRRELHKKRRHLPIRRLMQEAGRAIQAMKPVFMMSPMSIANFMTPGSMDFDLVIFDEASQVKPVDAFGAILRGNQVVVVGDNKQLPPTSFFDALSEIGEEDEDTENVTAEMESILGLFQAQNAPERMLRWHYRSRHDSLITVSNHEFYQDRLLVFPSPSSDSVSEGLVFHHLPNTHYDRGKTRTNTEEARFVAAAVMEHAKLCPELTLGVAAFSMAQRDAILAQIELMRRRDDSCEKFFNSHQEEPFFVKNLENVQGDERDVIFISVGYGKTKEGYLSMGFGPLNREGGERRLNVLITRARQTCRVFANFVAEDLDVEHTNARGVIAFRNFLAYAKDRVIDLPQQTDHDIDSPFEAQVANALASYGHRVQVQVGSAGFRVDIGIKDESKPGRYLLGIECDGATYHSACSARDRDRLRQDVLESLGWRIHRIWSSDWFRNSEMELRRAIEAIEKAKIHWMAVDACETQTQIQAKSILAPDLIERGQQTKQDATAGISSIRYERVQLVVKLRNRELHMLSTNELLQYIELVVGTEGPVHSDIVVQRITDGAGVQRAGNRIQRSIENAIAFASRSGRVRAKNEFLWPVMDKELVVRDRSDLEQAERKLQFVASEEIGLALEKVVASSFSIDRDDAISQCLGLLGFARSTAGAKQYVEVVLANLVQQGKMSLEGNVLTIASR